ncbi:MAG: hypothetical protein ACR2IT_09545 [Pirellulales bacterium]
MTTTTTNTTERGQWHWDDARGPGNESYSPADRRRIEGLAMEALSLLLESMPFVAAADTGEANDYGINKAADLHARSRSIIDRAMQFDRSSP